MFEIKCSICYNLFSLALSQIKEECYIHSPLCILSVIFIVWRHIYQGFADVDAGRVVSLEDTKKKLL